MKTLHFFSMILIRQIELKKKWHSREGKGLLPCMFIQRKETGRGASFCLVVKIAERWVSGKTELEHHPTLPRVFSIHLSSSALRPRNLLFWEGLRNTYWICGKLNRLKCSEASLYHSSKMSYILGLLWDPWISMKQVLLKFEFNL